MHINWVKNLPVIGIRNPVYHVHLAESKIFKNFVHVLNFFRDEMETASSSSVDDVEEMVGRMQVSSRVGLKDLCSYKVFVG